MSQVESHKTVHPKEIQQNNKKFERIIKDGFSPIVIKNFYDIELCKTIVQRINHQLENNKKSKKIGISLVSYANKKSEYFLHAMKARKTMQEIFLGLEDPRKKIHNFLGKIFSNSEIAVATENDKKYACGIIRIHALGDYVAIHRDNVRFEARDFSVSNYQMQLSAVLYLQQSEKGGELVLYKKQWSKSDEKFRNIEFGYTRDVIAESTN